MSWSDCTVDPDPDIRADRSQPADYWDFEPGEPAYCPLPPTPATEGGLMARYVVTVYREPVGASFFRFRAKRIASGFAPSSAVRIARVRRGRLAPIA